MNKKTLIMGVGNVLQGDEGFGAFCARHHLQGPLDKIKVKNDGPMISMHDQTITEVISIAKMTGIDPDVLVIGIEPKFIGTSLELSSIAQAAMPKVIEEIRKELEATSSKISY